MRNHRLATLVVAAAMATASGLAVASPAHAEIAIFQLVSGANGQCLQPAGGSSAPGAAIAQEPCNLGLAQQWIVTSASSGVHLVNRSSGLCLDARGGPDFATPIEQWPCDWISNEDWKYGDGQQLASGVSGTYTYCIGSWGDYAGLQPYLNYCNGAPGELWYRLVV
jgi:Ricin-type beta-trefoil lectin domain-like